jgi:hypothetical protein
MAAGPVDLRLDGVANRGDRRAARIDIELVDDLTIDLAGGSDDPAGG